MSKVIRINDTDIAFLEVYRQYCIKKADNNVNIIALLEKMTYPELLHYTFIGLDKRFNMNFYK